LKKATPLTNLTEINTDFVKKSDRTFINLLKNVLSPFNFMTSAAIALQYQIDT